MRRRWLKKAGAVYLAASMTLLPVAQSAMAEETVQETSSESPEMLLDESTSEVATNAESVAEVIQESTATEPVTEESTATEPVTEVTEESAEIETTASVETTAAPETQVSEEAKTEESETKEVAQESESVVSTEEATKEIETEIVKETSDAASEAESTVEETTEPETAEIDVFEGTSDAQVLTNSSTTYESNGYQYTVEDGKANLVKYVGSEKNVVIPSKLNGYLVTKLTSNVFRANKTIESVVIPASITEYEVIGLNLFTNCKSLKYVKIESSADIVDSMFDRCTSIETIEITGKPTQIGAYAFQGTKMKSFQIPSSVKMIDSCAFSSSGLEEITIPATVESAGAYIFQNSESLKYVKYESAMMIPYQCFIGCTKLKKVEVTGAIDRIRQEAFYETGLEEFVIPSTVTAIEEFAFANTKLKQVTIPASVIEYGNNIFIGCEELTSVRIESSADIAGGMFSGCIKLTNLEITGRPKAIGDMAFYRTPLKDAVIPDSVTSIGDGNPFKKETDTDTPISENGFQYDVVDGNAVITGYVGNKTDVTLPATLGGYPVTKVSSMSGNSVITSLVIPKTITSYERGAFKDCTALTSVKIESSADIPEYLFWGCDSIRNVEFTGQPSSIGDGAFCGANLKDVKIPSSVKKIGYAAFTRVDSTGNYLYTLEDGNAVLLDYVGTQTDVVIPGKLDDYALTEIGSANTGSYQNIQRLTIPASIKSYHYNGGGIFEEQKNLRYVKIESSANILPGMFYDCEALETVELTGRPTQIGQRAFQKTSIKKFDIPTSVTGIGYDAFAETNLENIVIPSSVGGLDWGIASNCPNLVSATVGCRNADSLAAAFSGCDKLKRIELEPTVEWFALVGLYPSYFNNLCGKGITLYVTEGTLAEEIAKECEQWGYDYVVIPKNHAGLVNMGDNVWYYKVNGVTQWNYTGLVKYYGTWYYVEKGILNWNYTGLTNYYGTWYYVQKGVLNWNYTGLTNYYGTWYYVEKGVLNWNYTGLTNYYGIWYCVQKGVLDWNYTGLVNYYGTWYYVEKGVLSWNYTGLTNYYGTWYYVQRGILNWNYTGLTKYYGTWYYVEKGILNWNYTGLVNYYGTRYYVQKGVLRWGYNGYVTQDGTRYYVQNSIAKML